MVEPSGIEPLTSTLPAAQNSPSKSDLDRK